MQPSSPSGAPSDAMLSGSGVMVRQHPTLLSPSLTTANADSVMARIEPNRAILHFGLTKFQDDPPTLSERYSLPNG